MPNSRNKRGIKRRPNSPYEFKNKKRGEGRRCETNANCDHARQGQEGASTGQESRTKRIAPACLRELPAQRQHQLPEVQREHRKMQLLHWEVMKTRRDSKEVKELA